MIIEVMDWADFDIPYTKWIGENLEYSDCNEIRESFIRGFLGSENITEFELTSNGASRINHNLLYGLTDKFIDFLKQKGFKKVKTVRIKFSD